MNGDQFCYSPKFVMAALEYRPILEQAAALRPHSGAALVLYDLSRALDEVDLTSRQAVVLQDLARGYTEMEIGIFLKIGQRTVSQHKIFALKKLVSALNKKKSEDDTSKTPPPTALIVGGNFFEEAS